MKLTHDTPPGYYPGNPGNPEVGEKYFVHYGYARSLRGKCAGALGAHPYDGFDIYGDAQEWLHERALENDSSVRDYTITNSDASHYGDHR